MKNVFSIGNDELDVLPELGKTIKCPICGREHPVKQSVDGDGHPGCLQYYNCGKKTYLAGINHKQLNLW